MNLLIRENLVKNALIILALASAYSPVRSALSSDAVTQSPGLAGDLLVAVSILAVTACFGNFAFTYEKSKLLSLSERLLAHSTTGLLMLLIGLSLMMTTVLSEVLIGPSWIMKLTFLILYVASVLYDFWDLLRLQSQ